MSKTKNKEPKKDNRFAEIIDNLGTIKEGKDFPEYLRFLDLIEDSDKTEPIPFPYGGRPDFGKWAAQGR